MIDIHVVKDKKEFDEIIKIREGVFIQEQNVPIDREIDGLDDSSKHIIVLYNSTPARIPFIDNKIKLERIAVLEKFRKNGLE